MRAAARREVVDRPPYAFWRHFPTADRSPAALAQATLRFHDRYGSDFLVVVPPAGYAAQAWGCVEADTPRADGSRPCTRCAVARPEDWGAIRALDPAAAPGYAEVVETLVRVGFDRRIGDAPVLVLLPAPSTVAARLGGGRLAAHLREWPGLVGDALRALAETQIRFAELCLAEGLAGVLYAVHVACRARARRVDLRRAARAPRPRGAGRRSTAGPRCAWSHVTGPVPFARVATWPADVVGWAASADLPALADGHARLRGAALGGLDARALRDEPPAAAVLAARRRRSRPPGTGARRRARRARLAGHAGRGARRRRPGPGGLDSADPRHQPLTVRATGRASRRAPRAGAIRITWA